MGRGWRWLLVGVSTILRGGEGESRWPGLVCRVGGGGEPSRRRFGRVVRVRGGWIRGLCLVRGWFGGLCGLRGRGRRGVDRRRLRGSTVSTTVGRLSYNAVNVDVPSA
jgi:hypothetical protein